MCKVATSGRAWGNHVHNTAVGCARRHDKALEVSGYHELPDV